MTTARILVIGDIIGRPGRRLIRDFLPSLKTKWQIDCVIANIENSAGGFGITHQIYSELIRYGVDLMSSGNHLFDKPETETWIDSANQLVRPLNYPPETPGNVTASFQIKDRKITVLTLMGRVFMPPYDCPFRGMDTWLESRDPHEIILVDMHAEATSEKQAMGWHLCGRVSAVWGTHTHIPTADARILDGYTGYITDVGMTGPYDSVIGMKRDAVLKGFKTLKKNRFEVAKDDPRLACCLLEVDADTQVCKGITSRVLTLNDLENEVSS